MRADDPLREGWVAGELVRNVRGGCVEVAVELLRAASSKKAMDAPAEEGEGSIARILIDIIEQARKSNGIKGHLLKTVIFWEVGATLPLAIAVAIVLWVGS